MVCHRHLWDTASRVLSKSVRVKKLCDSCFLRFSFRSVVYDQESRRVFRAPHPPLGIGHTMTYTEEKTARDQMLRARFQNL
jgi:hypothetical protein